MTGRERQLIMVTRPREDAEELAAELSDRGFDTCIAPMLSTEAVEADVPPLERFSGLVFTSRYGVRHFTALEKSRSLPVFAVGDATAEAARAAGFSDVISAKGAGEDLAKLIGKRGSGGLRLLHAGGAERVDGWTENIAGAEIVPLVLYQSKPAREFPEDVLELFKVGRVNYVLLFSPATARNFVTLTRAAGLEKCAEKAVAICLSRMVADVAGLLPWRRLLVAGRPDKKSLLEMLMSDAEQQQTPRREFPSEPVIEAFGGIRPLALRLGLTASTVQGWKIRGVIPAARLYDVVRAANEDGLEVKGMDAMLAELGRAGQPFEEKRAGDERRRVERRHQSVPVEVDRRKSVDRRSGLDRRHEEYKTHQKEQRARVRRARLAFFDNAAVTAAFIFMAVVLAGAVLLAPEFLQLKEKAAKIEKLEKQVSEMHARIDHADKSQSDLGGRLNHRIEELQKGADTMMENIARVAAGSGDNWQERLADIQRRTAGLGSVVLKSDDIRRKPGGDEEYRRMIGDLQAVVAGTGGDAGQLPGAVEQLRLKNASFASVVEGVEPRDAAAAAMLLALNEFRSSIGTGRPFAQDLATMKALTGASPDMNKSLDELAPYADRGILSMDALSTEFKGLASDIVMAKLEGRDDLSVRERALARFSGLIKIRRVDQIEGNDPDAVVARAKLRLDAGDVRGAIAELETLEGAPAQKAGPWINDARASVQAGDTGSLLSRYIMAQVASGGQYGSALDKNMMDLILSGHPLDALLPRKPMPIISVPGSGSGTFPALGSGASTPLVPSP